MVGGVTSHARNASWTFWPGKDGRQWRSGNWEERELGGAASSLMLPIQSAGENIYLCPLCLGSSMKLCVGLIISIYFV